MTDFDQVEIAAPGSRMYQDALEMALRSGKAYSEIYYDDEPIDQGFEGMQDAYIPEDVPSQAQFTNDLVPEF